LHSASSDLSDVDADRPFAGMTLDKMRSSSAKPPARLAPWTRRTFNTLGLKTSLGRSTRNGSRGSPHVWACLAIVPVLGPRDGTCLMRLPSAEGACVRAIHCYVLRLTPMGSCRTRGGAYLDRYVTDPAAAWQLPGRHRRERRETENVGTCSVGAKSLS